MQKMGTFKQKSEVLMNLNKNLMSQCVFQYQACKPIKHHNHWNIFKVGMACGKRKQACEHRYRNVMLVQEWQSRAQSNKHKKRRFSLFLPICTFLFIVFYFLTSVLQVSCCWKLMMSIFFWDPCLLVPMFKLSKFDTMENRVKHSLFEKSFFDNLLNSF